MILANAPLRLLVTVNHTPDGQLVASYGEVSGRNKINVTRKGPELSGLLRACQEEFFERLADQEQRGE